MKKKLEDAYIPDKKGRKEKVLIALSGGIDSYVTAYLLKIQKYELSAVTIVNSWEDLTGDGEDFFSCVISPSKLEEIKSFCHKLNIPHQIVKSSQEFKENVIDPWMAEKVLGGKSSTCWNCHELRMNLIYEKMKELGADKIATGHYAKLFYNENYGSVFVHTSNDELNDQSSLLSRLEHDVLKSLILPLSDLTKKEVMKLGENFGLLSDKKKVSIHQCLSNIEALNPILKQKIPGDFIAEGEISSPDGTQSFGHHDGVLKYSLGDEFEYKENGKSLKGFIAGYNFSEKRIIVAESSYIMRKKALLNKCHFSEGVAWPEPVKGYVIFSQKEAVECWIHPKSLSSVFIEFSEDQKLIDGEIVSVIKKKGKNSKVLLTGQIRLLPSEPKDPEVEETPPKASPYLDF